MLGGLVVLAGVIVYVATSSGGGGSVDPAAAAPKPVQTVTAQSSNSKSEAQTSYATLHCPSTTELAVVHAGTASDYLATCGLDCKFLLAPAVADGTQITFATAAPATGGSGGYVLDLSFDSEGAKSFDAAAAELYDQIQASAGEGQMAVVVNGLVISAPVMDAGVGSNVQISKLDQREATALANLLRSQPSAVQFRPVLDFSLG